MQCPNCGRTIYNGKLYKCDLCGDIKCGACKGTLGQLNCLTCHSGHYQEIKKQSNNSEDKDNNYNISLDRRSPSGIFGFLWLLICDLFKVVYRFIRWFIKYLC